MTQYPVRHISVSIARHWEDVYAFLAEPGNFPKWAPGLGHSFRPLGGMEWLVETPVGTMKVRFSERNSFGVLDHAVIPENSQAMINPMRVFANGDGSEVLFTLFQRADMSDDEFASDADLVARDLQSLKALLEA
jgi:hypothetical protein